MYNRQSSRRDLKKFAKIPDVDVDFDAEMERILDTFRITELAKRNFRNRGLQGKELKVFEELIDSFKSLIVEDLVLIKKDSMEVRMRRAGYLRYTNKTGYGKTGRLVSALRLPLAIPAASLRRLMIRTSRMSTCSTIIRCTRLC